MPKAKTKEPRQRRSVPLKEVEQLLDEAVRNVKSDRTIYDDRIELLNSINQMNEVKAHHEQCLHNCEVSLKDLHNQLSLTNLAIRREMELESI
jgi:hypothetical protein